MPDDHAELLKNPVDGPDFLDALWKAYEDTKDLEYVKRVLTVLDWNDGVRSRIESWLSQLPDNFAAELEYELIQQRFIQWTMPVDLSKKTIDGPVDLDLHVALLARQGQLKFDELPVTLDEQDLIRLAMKSAAFWSLTSFASRDPAVADFCEVEATRPGGAARQLLAVAGAEWNR